MKLLNRKTAKITKIYPAKILMFGGGNFLRAFVAWMVDELNKNTDFNGSILCVKPTPKGDYSALRNQDGLFHLITQGIENGQLVKSTQLIQSIQQIIHPYREWASFIESAKQPNLRFIVSNTTESGIQFSKKDELLATPPKEFPAKLCLWLYHRWQFFSGAPEKGCIILPCELIEQNGDQLKAILLQYAELWELEIDFKNWLLQSNYFCNTLVDRIVPGFPTKQHQSFQQQLGYADALMVTAEPYHQWVIQGPAVVQKELPFQLTQLNVTFTNDLTPYRQMKVRILNGAHTAMVPVGYLKGLETVRAAVEDEEVGHFIQNLIYQEIIPSLDYPLEQLNTYAQNVLDRFKNPFIHHLLLDISLNSIAKFKTRLLPSLLDYHKKYHHYPSHILKALLALINFYRGEMNGMPIPLRDDESVLTFFQAVWQEWNHDKNKRQLITSILKEQKLWGQDLSTKISLVDSLVSLENEA